MLTNDNYFQSVRYNYLGLSVPLGQTKTVLGIEATALDYGVFDRTEIINSGSDYDYNRIGGFGARDLAIGLGFGAELRKGLAVGGALKYIKLALAEYNATGIAADLGIQYKPEIETPLKFGLGLTNAGAKIKFQSQKEKLPLTLRAGCNMDLNLFENFSIVPAADLVISNNNDVGFNLGGEFEWFKSYALRCGYNSLNDVGSGISLGIGAKFSGLAFDYAFTPYSKLGNSHNITLSCGFGKTAEKKEKSILTSEQSVGALPIETLLKMHNEPAEQRTLNNVLYRIAGINIIPNRIVVSPIGSVQDEKQLSLIRIILESELRFNLVLAHPSNQIIYREKITEYLEQIEKKYISSEYEAIGAGLYLNSDIVIFGNLMVLSGGKNLYYYKIFSVKMQKNIMEGILEFNDNSVRSAIQLLVNDLKNNLTY